MLLKGIKFTNKIMKKNILITAISCLALFAGSIPASPQVMTVYADESESYSFEMSASATESKQNDTFDVSVSIKKDDNENGKTDKFTMYAAEYTLIYDPTFFTLMSHPQLEKEDDRGVTYMMQQNADKNGWTALTASVKSPDVEGLEWDSPSELMKLSFRADKTGAGVIKCKSAAVGNIYGGNVSCSSNDVTVTVVNADSGSSGSGSGFSGGNGSGGNSSTPSTGGGSAGSSGGSNNGSAAAPDNSAKPPTDQTPGADNGAQSSSAFTDVKESDWFSGAVKYVTEKGLFNGTGNGAFSPQVGMNRAMLVTVLWRLDGSPAVTGGAGFADVAQDRYYATAVKWASQNSIVNGVTVDSFAPESYVTREQIAAMIYRYAQYRGTDISSSETLGAYSDAADISGWAQPAVKWAVGRGVMSGMTDSTIRPGNTATRAQVAAMLMRFAG